MLQEFLNQLFTSFVNSPIGNYKWKYGKVRYNLKLRATAVFNTAFFLILIEVYLITQREEGYSTFVLTVFLSLLVLSVVTIGMFCIWNIDYDEEKIIYRSALGIKHIIPYEEITSIYSNPFADNGDGNIEITSGKVKIRIAVKSCIGAGEFLYFCRKYVSFQLNSD